MTSSVKISEATSNLINKGRMSKKVGDRLAGQERDIKVVDVKRGFEAPVFSCFVFDSSGSMKPYQQDMINGYPDLIDPLRKSRKCKKKVLYIAQYLFSDYVKLIHPFTKLDKNANDDVVFLNTNNYRPDGMTALYKTLFYLLQDMAANISNAVNQNIRAEFTIGVITDGEDTEGEIQPDEIKETIQELKGKNFLRSSVIIGLTNTDFSSNMLETLREKLGFDQAISLSQNGKEIRDSFGILSESSLAAI